ncbi:MAG: T9SS type A sorting domain-containing protein [Bacteroidota bacterium]
MKVKSLLLMAFLWSSITAYSQDEHVLVVAPYDGTNITLDKVISGDTTSTGERKDLNRIYQLQRGGIYLMDAIVTANYSLKIIASPGTERPPIVYKGYDANGIALNKFFSFVGHGNSYAFQDIIFNAVNDKGEYDKYYHSGLSFAGDNTRLEVKACVFNGFQSGAIRMTGKDNTVYLSDNVWRNGNAKYHPFVGQQGTYGVFPMDTLVVTNNTFFNNHGYSLLHGTGSGLIDYAVVEHNTFYTSLVPVLELREMINLKIRSNIFYGIAAYGDTELSRSGNWYVNDGESALSTMYFTEVSGNQLFSLKRMREKDRKISVTNNAYFTPQAIEDYNGKSYTDATGGVTEVTGTVWMNEKVQAMFDNSTAYPYFDDSDNYNADPGFKSVMAGGKDVNDWVVDELAYACVEYRETMDDPTKGWGACSSRRNIDEDLVGEYDILRIQWPLVEGNHEITNPNLLSAGHDGLPVGNLNWDSALRKEYVLPDGIGGMQGLGIGDFVKTAEQYSLSNYPNPANNFTTISFNLPTKREVKISIYNLLGQEVEVVAQDELSKGHHELNIDLSSYSVGLYLYVLETENGTQVNRMIIQK